MIGSTLNQRSIVGSHKAIDIIANEDLLATGKMSLPEALNELVPAFNYNYSTLGLEQDLIRPSTLRGMGTDQMLLLVNGKPFHTQSVITTSPTSFNPGFSGYDLTAIPLQSIDYVEVIRDGASAQFGSGAIAGVINVVLKSYEPSNAYAVAAVTDKGDGEASLISANLLLVNSNTHEIQLFLELQNNNGFNRSAKIGTEDGLSSLKQLNQTGQVPFDMSKLWFNHNSRFDNGSNFYSFGGYSETNGSAFAVYHSENNEKNWQELYPNGFQPKLDLKVSDSHLTLGYLFNWSEYETDLSLSLSSNKTDRNASNTLNNSYGPTSPTSGDIGNLELKKLTLSGNIQGSLPSTVSTYSTNFNLGMTLTREWFGQTSGTEVSYELKSYCREDYKNDGEEPDVGFGLCSMLTPGFVSFPGFSEDNSVSKKTESGELFVLFNQPISEQLEIDLGFRYTNYFNFDHAWVYDLSTLYRIDQNISLRGAVSTGFRMPSMQQRYFSETNSYTSDGFTLSQHEMISSDSELHTALGLDLKAEKSEQVSMGVIYTGELWSSTFDFFYNQVKDRITLSNPITYNYYLSEPFDDTRNSVRVFTNSVYSKTYGIDWINYWLFNTDNYGQVKIDLSYHYHKNKVMDISSANTAIPDELLFSDLNTIDLESSQPQQNAVVSIGMIFAESQLTLRSNYIGSYDVIYPNSETYHWGEKILTSASYSIEVTDDIVLSMGINNLFNSSKDKLSNDAIYNQQYGFQYGLQSATSHAGRNYFLTFDYSL
ncbi:TonB-dependent receptor [Thalassotalea nanhaiensis]|uniref:TonB-dependent receptor n=1 Tax=Thalassotalea nanhaiensis TaxID=3065648 RepID=A0ABY9TM88_9GAMM|nr:TonB-dependent receptor [Colwelliaceae bacterium SQ345]